MQPATASFEELEKRAGYTFRNRELLREALTHRSYLNESDAAKDNERLEFFGDAILDFALSHFLIERFPESREGELTRMRASLVDEESLAQAAERLDLGNYLLLGRGEERSGGRRRRSILADAYEAFLAAVFLDGGLDPVRRLVESQMEYLREIRPAAGASTDYKTEFQELVQSRFGATPHYVVVDATGPDHRRIFTVAAFVREEPVGQGTGRSKKEAEQRAAAEALASLRVKE